MGGSKSKIANIDLKGKVAIVTGANTGIGLATAKGLAGLGAKVIVTVRSSDKGISTVKEIKERYPSADVEWMKLELASLDSVREFTKTFKEKGIPLHLLINNAGIMNTPYGKTVDGFEQQFAVNHLSHFLLTLNLLDILENSAPSKIINLSSDLHKNGKFDWNDINFEKKYSGFDAYARSKVANVMFTYELARRLEGLSSKVTVNAVHPGVVSTELMRTTPFMKIARPFLKSPQQGSMTTLTVAIDPNFDQTTGKYFDNSKIASSSIYSQNKEEQKKLWDLSFKLTGLNIDPTINNSNINKTWME